MTEKYDFIAADQNGYTHFNNLMLNSRTDYIDNDANFDSRKLEVDLKINGVSVRIDDFNKVMDVWAERLIVHLKEQLGVLSAENAVEERAVKLLEEKCKDAMEILYHIENSSYKVYDD